MTPEEISTHIRDILAMLVTIGVCVAGIAAAVLYVAAIITHHHEENKDDCDP